MLDSMNDLTKEYQSYLDKKLNIDMSRGKPCLEQLNLSLPMLDVVNSKTNCFDAIILLHSSLRRQRRKHPCMWRF